MSTYLDRRRKSIVFVPLERAVKRDDQNGEQLKVQKVGIFREVDNVEKHAAQQGKAHPAETLGHLVCLLHVHETSQLIEINFFLLRFGLLWSDILDRSGRLLRCWFIGCGC